MAFLVFRLDSGPLGHNPILGHFRIVGENEAAGAADAAVVAAELRWLV